MSSTQLQSVTAMALSVRTASLTPERSPTPPIDPPATVPTPGFNPRLQTSIADSATLAPAQLPLENQRQLPLAQPFSDGHTLPKHRSDGGKDYTDGPIAIEPAAQVNEFPGLIGLPQPAAAPVSQAATGKRKCSLAGRSDGNLQLKRKKEDDGNVDGLADGNGGGGGLAKTSKHEMTGPSGLPGSLNWVYGMEKMEVSGKGSTGVIDGRWGRSGGGGHCTNQQIHQIMSIGYILDNA